MATTAPTPSDAEKRYVIDDVPMRLRLEQGEVLLRNGKVSEASEMLSKVMEGV